jgi:hypothetical protein
MTGVSPEGAILLPCLSLPEFVIIKCAMRLKLLLILFGIVARGSS